MADIERTRIIIAGTAILLLFAALIWFIGNYPPEQCDAVNFAWEPYREECDCSGIKVNTTCISNGQPCPDAPLTTGCIGRITERRCYEFLGYNANNISEPIWIAEACKR